MRDSVQVGIAYCDRIADLLSRPTTVDYVEIPYELLKTTPGVIESVSGTRVVLHCASLSVAGTIPPHAALCEDVSFWARRTETPWIGEHLAFIVADSDANAMADEYAPGEPYNIGYTVSPAYDSGTIARIQQSLQVCRRSIESTILLENVPVYVPTPASNMSPAQFMSEVCRVTDVGLLLDLTHWLITCDTLGLDPFAEMRSLPWHRIVETHVSGVERESHVLFDNHASTAPTVVIDLLSEACKRADNLAAVTLEYNWSSTVPVDTLVHEIERVRQAVVGAMR